MDGIVRQSTSFTAQLGKFIDDTDGVTAETGLTIANTDIRISKAGGAFAAKNSGGGTHDENGYYSVTYDATDTATVGLMKVACKVAGALAVEKRYQVVEEAIYDALYASGATGLLPANVTQISGDSGAADNCESFFDGTGYAGTNNVIPTVTALTNKTGFSLASTGLDLVTAWTVDITGSLSGSVGSVSGAVGSISGVTFPSNFSMLGINASGHVSRVTFVDTTTTNTDMRGTNNALLASSAPTNFGDLSISATTGLVSLAADQSGVTIGTVNAATLAASQPNYAPNTTTPPTAAAIADAVWGEAIADHSGTSGSTAESLSNASAPTAAQVADAVWTEAIADHSGVSGSTAAKLNGLSASQGTGANSITPTVNDGTDPLESAKVRFTKGAESYIGTTNASGTFTTPFSLDNGTWTVAITLPGYTFTQTTLVVTGNATPTYSMTASGLSVPESPRIRARLLVLDKTTKLGKAGFALTIVEAGPSTTDGYASETASRTVTSDANGLAEWYALPGERYQITGPLGVQYSVKISDSATDPHNVDSVLV